MGKVQEPSERAMYRAKCQNYSPYTGQCYAKSGWMTPFCHVTIGCDGKCRRMKRYDKLHGIEKGTEFEIKDFA